MIFKYLVLILITCVQLGISQGQINLQFDIDSYIEYVVTDKWGRNTGTDPRYPNLEYHEIPQSAYGPVGFGDSKWSNQFGLSIIIPQEAGVFTIKLISKKLSLYTFYCNADPENTTMPKGRFVISSFLDLNVEQIYKLTIDGNPITPEKLEKLIAITTLAQDVSAGGKLNLVGNQTFANSLITQCNQMAAFYNSGDKRHAHYKLNDLKALIQGAYYGPTSTVFVNQYAYDVLLEDINLTFTLIGYNGTIEDRPQKN